ncbi:hypothetical protein F383_19553 [Gossypium arboreum]|uniref:Uncharacterized protein n=1 Tax=Gossypium arboreum TaxID=29729 RepID=A0A0B0NPJ3_GOSAR|nr:hypothetical protein F383_19553 [Gossypium arboreum]
MTLGLVEITCKTISGIWHQYETSCKTIASLLASI